MFVGFVVAVTAGSIDSGCAHTLLRCWALLPQLPSFLTDYGWSLQAATTRHWYTMLAEIVVSPLSAPRPGGQVLQLFTDGSCIHQSYADFRFAAWAVVSAQADDNDAGVVLDCGHLPGVLQNAYRAEICCLASCPRCSQLSV